MNLYRILSLESFVDLLHNKRERYARPSFWKDVFEGYLFSQIYDCAKQKKIVEEIYYTVCKKNPKDTMDTVLKLEHAKWFIYGQCWSREAESDALWRIYSYGNHSVQIQTTKQRIEELLLQGEIKYKIIEKVKYDVEPEDDILHKQIMQIKDTTSIYEPYLHKRKAFKHEEEYRVLIDDVRWYGMTEMNMMGATWNISEYMNKMKNDEEVIDWICCKLNQYMNKWKMDNLSQSFYLKVDELGKYITGVTINPFAEDWYVDLIKDLCKEYKIQCNGQSQLYTPFGFFRLARQKCCLSIEHKKGMNAVK